MNIFKGCEGCYYNEFRLANSDYKCFELTKLYINCPCKICLIKGMCIEPCDKISEDPTRH
jgi:hypothetical protein